MSFLNFLNNDAVGSSDDYIVEAVEKFSDLPDSWKKSITYSFDGLFGENSKFDVISKKVTDFDKLSTEINKSISKNAKQNGLSIIEINGEAYALVIRNTLDEDKYNYSVKLATGNFLNDKVFINKNRYKVSRFEDTKFMKPIQARDKIIEEISKIINKYVGISNKTKEEILNDLDFTVKNITIDENRIKKSEERKDSRKGIGSDILDNKQKAIRKYAHQAVKHVVDDIYKSLPDKRSVDEIMDDALEGKKFELGTLEDVSKKVKDLNELLHYFSKAYENPTVFGRSRKYNFYTELMTDIAKKIKDSE